MREMTMSNTHNETDPPTENTELILSSVDVPEATEAGPDDLVGVPPWPPRRWPNSPWNNGK